MIDATFPSIGILNIVANAPGTDKKLHDVDTNYALRQCG